MVEGIHVGFDYLNSAIKDSHLMGIEVMAPPETRPLMMNRISGFVDKHFLNNVVDTSAKRV